MAIVRLGRVNLKPENADLGPRIAHLRPGRVNFRPERADLRPAKAD